MDAKLPLPPYTLESAAQKVRLAEDAWNSRDPDRVALVYTEDRPWRNRAEFPVGREQVRQFLQRKWARELDYRPVKEIWACGGVLPASTTCPSRPGSASSTGRSGGVPTIIPA